MRNPTAFTASEERWSWADQGNCVGSPDLFYNSDDEPKSSRRKREEWAKRLCESCPVMSACRRYALENRELYGVWGGMTENERHRLAGRARTG